jgi:AGZA family xanthine/uracil permease-like MFS transporter
MADATAGNLLERLFALRERGTTVRREALAGAVTFLTMAYIVAVNPGILKAAGLPVEATVAATCLAAAIPCLLMGLWANWPLALAPGMGLNAFLTFSVVVGMGAPWQTAMGIVFVEGALIALLVAFGVREAVLRAIPGPLKVAIGVGIGLFIAFIGLQHAGWVVKDPATLVGAGSFRAAPTIVASLGLLVTAALMARRVPGALLLGVVATALLAAIASVPPFSAGLMRAPDRLVALPDLSTFGRLDIPGALRLKFAATIFAFLMTDFFDTMGTVVAVGRQAGLLGRDGSLSRLNRVLLVDSLAACWGGLCSASSVTCYVESAAGVGEGGRTGLSTVVTGLLFLAAMFFAPVIGVLPEVATAPALIVVGFLMLSQVAELSFDRFEEAFPAFVTLLAIPLTFSIARGVALGFLSYVLLAVLRGRAREVPPLLWPIAALFALSLAL